MDAKKKKKIRNALLVTAGVVAVGGLFYYIGKNEGSTSANNALLDGLYQHPGDHIFEAGTCKMQLTSKVIE